MKILNDKTLMKELYFFSVKEKVQEIEASRANEILLRIEGTEDAIELQILLRNTPHHLRNLKKAIHSRIRTLFFDKLSTTNNIDVLVLLSDLPTNHRNSGIKNPVIKRLYHVLCDKSSFNDIEVCIRSYWYAKELAEELLRDKIARILSTINDVEKLASLYNIASENNIRDTPFYLTEVQEFVKERIFEVVMEKYS